jgi:hypothetical protein
MVLEPPEYDGPKDCTVESHQEAIFRRDSPLYRRIEVKYGAQLGEETAFPRGSRPKVKISISGCHHLSVLHVIQLEDMRDTDDLTHYAERALDILEELHLGKGAANYVAAISAIVRPKLATPEGVGDCELSDGNIATVSCAAHRNAEGIVEVGVSYDVTP